MSEVEARARELLATEYDKLGAAVDARVARHGGPFADTEGAAIRAIVAALQPHAYYGPCDALGPNGSCAECLKQAALQPRAGLDREAIPEGYVLVPREPTEEMVEAGAQAHDDEECPIAVWSAMIFAAPPPPSEMGEG